MVKSEAQQLHDSWFSGATKESPIVGNLIEFMQRIISRDYSAESHFLGDFNRWCEARIKNGQINIIDGKEIGTKTMDDKTILIDDLLSNNYLNIYLSNIQMNG